MTRQLAASQQPTRLAASSVQDRDETRTAIGRAANARRLPLPHYRSRPEQCFARPRSDG